MWSKRRKKSLEWCSVYMSEICFSTKSVQVKEADLKVICLCSACHQGLGWQMFCV